MNNIVCSNLICLTSVLQKGNKFFGMQILLWNRKGKKKKEERKKYRLRMAAFNGNSMMPFLSLSSWFEVSNPQREKFWSCNEKGSFQNT